MTNWKTTLTLLVLVVGMSVWVWLGEPHLASGSTSPYVEKTLFPTLKREQVVRVQLVRDAEQLQLVAEREDPNEEADSAKWKLVAPVADKADHAKLRAFVNNLQFAMFQSRLGERETKTFDFGAVEMQVALDRKDAPQIVMAFGKKQPSGEVPLQISGREGVFLVRGDFVDVNFPKKVWDWRAKEVLALADAQITGVQVEGSAAPTLALTMADGFWRYGAKDGEFAAPNRVEEVLSALRHMAAREIEVESPKAEDLERTGLAAPLARLALESAPEGGEKKEPAKNEVVTVGGAVPNEEGVHFVRSTSKGPVYKVDVAALLNALRGKPEEWRSDVLLPITGNVDTVSGFGVKLADGTETVLEKKEEGWFFKGTKVPVSESKARDIAKQLIGLVALERPASVDSSGLSEPALRIGLDEGTLHRELVVGAPVEGKPGVHYVSRTGSPIVFTADLGTLPDRLRDARLELIDSELFHAVPSAIKKVSLLGEDGKPVLEAELVVEKVDGADIPTWKVKTQPSPAKADSDLFKSFVEQLGSMHVARWVWLDSETARKEAGLDAPEKLVIGVETFENNKPLIQERTILLGKRDGDRVHALNADHAGAIGLIDATFLDQIERGWGKGKEILHADKFQTARLQVEEGDSLRLIIEKRGQNYLVNGELQGGVTEAERVLEQFEGLQVTRSERATPEKVAELGLDKPSRKVTIVIKPQDGSAESTKVLLLGAKAGEREVWAMVEGADTLGALFDARLRVLDEFIAKHPRQAGGDFQTPPPEKPPETPPGDTAPVDTPNGGG